MDSFEWNKIIGAVLATALFVMVIRIGSEAVFHVPKPAKPSYQVPGVEQVAGPTPGAPPAEEALPDFGTVLAAANVEHGKQVAQRCTQCHDWTKGGPNRIGPNLFGVINRPPASEQGFSYSAAMKNKGGTWTYAELFQYLKQPATFIPGNKMAFAGLPRPQDRIDLLAYMRTWADSPAPLPPPNPAATAPAGQTTATAPNAPPGQQPSAAPAKPGATPVPAPTQAQPSPAPAPAQPAPAPQPAAPPPQ